MISDHFNDLETCSICGQKGEKVDWFSAQFYFGGNKNQTGYASFRMHSLICIDKEDCDIGFYKATGSLPGIFHIYNDEVNKENFSEKTLELANTLNENGFVDFYHVFNTLDNGTRADIADFYYPGKNRKVRKNYKRKKSNRKNK